MHTSPITPIALLTAQKAALAAHKWIGLGNGKAADLAAVEAMRTALNQAPINGTVVIGEGERDEAPMLYIGEKVGNGKTITEIALDPLEGTDLCAGGKPNSLAVIGMTEQNGHFLHAPDVYMEKIAVGFATPQGTLSLDHAPQDNIANYAKFIGKNITDITVCMLDRPRHEKLIEAVRTSGARIKLIDDGDIYAVMATALDTSEIDMYMGAGGAPEGVLAAAALRCVGGEIYGRLWLDTEEKQERAEKMGIKDPNRHYIVTDLAQGDVVFVATGVTNGDLLRGVEISPCGQYMFCESLILQSKDHSLQRIHARLALSSLSGNT